MSDSHYGNPFKMAIELESQAARIDELQAICKAQSKQIVTQEEAASSEREACIQVIKDGIGNAPWCDSIKANDAIREKIIMDLRNRT